ncbi:MAG: zinc-dependent alcohol dehydrogenase [Actinomycetota bacterium]
MRALVWKGVGKVAVEDVPRPAIGAPHEAIVKITSTTICGSDMHLYHASIPAMRKGDILGHECMGIVDEVGAGVEHLHVGDRVVVSAVIADGTCWYCRQGLFSACERTNRNVLVEEMYGAATGGIFGYSHLTGGYPGGQAEYIAVPYADVNTLKVPASLPDDKVLLLSDVVCTGWHATELGRVEKGQTVAVWGCGPIGLMAQEWARFRGASQVVAVDRIGYRLEVAASRGAVAVNFDEEDVIERTKELTDGRGPDVCIEAVGFRYVKSLHHRVQKTLKLETDSIDALNECIRSCRKYGWVSIVGDFMGHANQFPIGALMEKGLQAGSGQVHVQRYWHDLLAAIERGEFDPTFVISHRWPLERAAAAYDMFDGKEDNALKVVLTP